ncbi:hypothetical protein Tco_0230980 [Tanacetum coccineum]
MDSENDNEKASIPSFLPPEPTTSYVDDLDFFKDFKNKFLAIVYNDAQTSKSDYLTEQTLSPRHNNESDLNDETSLSEYDVVGQNILYGTLTTTVVEDDRYYLGTKALETDAILPTSRRGWRGFTVRRYTRFGDVLLDLDATGTIQFQLGGARRRLSWRHFILALGLHTGEEMEFPGFARYWSESERMIPGKGDLHDYWRSISTGGDFLGLPPSYTLIRDSVLRLFHRMMAHSIVGRSQAPEKVTVTDLRFAAGRKSGAHISGGQFVARLADHFGLLTAEILGGLTVIAPELPIIDMGELVRLQICMEVDDTWAWVAIRPERQPDAVAGALGVAQDAPIIDEGGQADPAPVQAPLPPAGSRTMPQRMARLEEDAHEIHGALTEQREVIDTMARDFSRFSTWAITRLAWMIDKAGVTYVPYSETHVPYQRRRVRQRTGEASTSAAQQDPQQPDP